MEEAEAQRLRDVYDLLCRKLGLLPFGLFKRQVGATTLDLHFNPLGDEAMRALSASIEVCRRQLRTARR